MELAERLKENRRRIGLSQEEVAERIFVSRQTISNWETDRTYPDVQSLLLLSDLFETPIDELVRGDVATMEKAVENDWKRMSRLVAAAWALVGVALVALVVGFQLPSGPSSFARNLSEGQVLGVAVFLALWLIGVVLLAMVEHMKAKNDLVTYRDILAYSKGQEPPRDGRALIRRHPMAMAWLKFAIYAVAGAVVGLAIAHLTN